MSTMEIVGIICAVLLVICLIVLLLVLDEVKDQSKEKETLKSDINDSITSFGTLISNNQQTSNQNQLSQFRQFEDSLHNYELRNDNKLSEMRQTIENRLAFIQQDNNRKLDEMRQTVDEKLQKTLEDKMNESFKSVSESLKQVYQSIGEMNKLASDVGDLKSVLSNVKTRGILGEIQLGAILKEILSVEQYDENVETVPGSGKRVEFAIKLPGNDKHTVYLPIDSKFPNDAYQDLLNAYNDNDPVRIDAAYKILETRIKSFAKDIHDKYIEVPYTTDFAIMFLPFEGLYSEVVNRGLTEYLQREYHINVAGPSTMAALLNSLQMGFKTLAIEKRSSEVWDILSQVKSEFDKFADVLVATQTRLNQANTELDKLVGTRTRAIQRTLKDVQSLDSKTTNLLDDTDEEKEA